MQKSKKGRFPKALINGYGQGLSILQVLLTIINNNSYAIKEGYRSKKGDKL